MLDTNVLVSGLLSPYGPPGEIVRMVSSGELQLYVDARVLGEYEAMLRGPKFGFDPDAAAALLDYIGYRSAVVAASPLTKRLPDPDDEPFLEIAVACEAVYLVTGNLRHFPEAACRRVAVVSPAKFMDAYRTERSGGG